jgi:hypothetical protein
MRPLLLGMTCYGERYINSFFNYTLPSLLSEGNIPALLKLRDVRFAVHTDKGSAHHFSDRGFIPICDVMEGDKYEQMGIHQHFDLALAKAKGADYHLLMPDFVYSGEFFTRMQEASKKHTAITRLVVSTAQETIWPYLKVGITAKELATLSLQHIHPGVRHWLVPDSGLPNNHVLAWQTENTLRMCSPHQTVVYIAHEAIKLDNSNLPLDSILDRIIEGPIYCPKPSDEMVIIEMSPRDSRKPNDKAIDLMEFVRIFKADTNNSPKQLEIFQEETVDSINRNALGGCWFNDIEISQQKRMVVKAIKGEEYAMGCCKF